jgi:heptosyltransferase-2
VADAKNILVIRLDEIGDVVLTIPLLKEIRRLWPTSQVTLITSSKVGPLMQGQEYVDKVITYDSQIDSHINVAWRIAKMVLFAVTRLRSGKYELVISPRWDIDFYGAGPLAFLSGARWRVGYSTKVTSKKQGATNGYDRFYTHLTYDTELCHECERTTFILRALDLKPDVGTLEITHSPDDIRFARQHVYEERIPEKRLMVALAPGARQARRRWPVDRYGALALWLTTNYKAAVVIVGGPEDEAYGEAIRQIAGSNVINMAGKADLRRSAAVLTLMDIFVGNDSAPMHMASAAKLPVVEISCHPADGDPHHPNSPARFGPWRVPRSILQPREAQAPCSGRCASAEPHCILGITVEMVEAEVRKLVERKIVGNHNATLES